MFLLSNNQQGGTILLLTVLVITATLVVTLTASDIIRTGILISRERHDSTKAYFAAEAGAERILWELRYNPSVDPEAGGLNCNPLGDYFCFDDTSGDIVSCNNPCPGGETASTTLDNNAFYTIWYEFEQSGLNSTTTLSATGVFRNVGRKVELLY